MSDNMGRMTLQLLESLVFLHLNQHYWNVAMVGVAIQGARSDRPARPARRIRDHHIFYQIDCE